jgi:glycosyltransferase involved in cell wall biosynthesis
MKVGIILPRTKTGEYRYGINIIKGLRQNNIDVIILNEFVPFITGSPTIKLILGSLTLKLYLKKEKLDVIHNIDNLPPYLFLSKNINDTKFIVTIHDIAPLILPKPSSFIMKFHFKILLPLLLKKSDFIITPSDSTKTDLINILNIDNSKIFVTHLGVNKSDFTCKKVKGIKEILKSKYGIDFPFILYVGGSDSRKNLERLIIAYINLQGKIPHKLILVGPIKKEKIMKIFKNNKISKTHFDNIKILGFIPNQYMPYIYSMADLFVYPSLYEGFGLPILEAIICEKIVVTSNVSSIPEIVGKAAILVNPLSVKEIAQGILRGIEDEKLRTSLIYEGRNLIKKYNWENTVKKTEQIYRL